MPGGMADVSYWQVDLFSGCDSSVPHNDRRSSPLIGPGLEISCRTPSLQEHGAVVDRHGDVTRMAQIGPLSRCSQSNRGGERGFPECSLAHSA
jgi:hypothetical protein